MGTIYLLFSFLALALFIFEWRTKFYSYYMKYTFALQTLAIATSKNLAIVCTHEFLVPYFSVDK